MPHTIFYIYIFSIYLIYSTKHLYNVYYTLKFISKSFILYFYKFLSILGLPIFYVKISINIFVKSKYRYIRDYRYFHPCSGQENSNQYNFMLTHKIDGGREHQYTPMVIVKIVSTYLRLMLTPQSLLTFAVNISQ